MVEPMTASAPAVIAVPHFARAKPYAERAKAPSII